MLGDRRVSRRFRSCFVLALLVVGGFRSFAAAILDPVDFLALQSVRKSLSDIPGSNFFASWDFTSDPCNFAGVYCDGDKVVSLNVGDPRAGTPGLTGRIASEIGKLSSLAEFTIVPGRVFGRLPQTMYQLKNLRFLAVSRNYISGRIPADLGLLRNLRTLDLGYNQLSGPIPRSVGTLPELSNLILCHNKLSGSVPPFISQSLTHLDLKHNVLTGSIGTFSLPSSLQYLSLSWNKLNGPVDGVLNLLESLNYLDLSMNQFSGPIPGNIFGFPISNLQLQRNAFTGRVRPSRQVTIPTVNLGYNRLSGVISPLFSTVQNLYLNNNQFIGHVPGSLVDRLLKAGIQVLYLQHNFLTGIEISPAANIPVRSSVCLQYNCMVPPLDAPCPLKAGRQKTRPTSQCIVWKRVR